MGVPRRAVVLAAAAMLLAGCRKKRPRVAAPPRVVRPGDTETGIASWYGHPYHGRRAANGEIYDMEKMTAAHRTLPFNTWVRVENLTNGRQVELRITDRGPFIDGRIIDISHAAARQIEMIGPGTAKVRVVVLSGPSTPAPSLFAVQVGAFRERRNADALRADMESRYGAARLVERAGNPVIWRVLAGAEPTEQAAEQLADRIRSEGVERNGAFVVRIDVP